MKLFNNNLFILLTYLLYQLFILVCTVIALERALNNIGRDDVVEKCNFAEIGHYPSQNGIYLEPEKHNSNFSII